MIELLVCDYLTTEGTESRLRDSWGLFNWVEEVEEEVDLNCVNNCKNYWV